ncbi:Transmembrane protein [Plasmodiophora brassicae]|uniref:Transmembrane protein n=1 Tax=Plasmodiophora brassicae TaxID=37360 RepID=A0A0G4IVS8_PLABS|nr:hypothetical protein PBRA_001253 [Plasmodiophora brassicae]SPQ97362.1 unnamed protein product [Plasmodiophora brassicae]
MGQDSSAVGFVAASGGAPVSLRDAVSASLQQQIEGDPSVKSELPSSEQSSEQAKRPRSHFATVIVSGATMVLFTGAATAAGVYSFFKWAVSRRRH